MWTVTDDDFHFDERIVDLPLPQLAFLSGAIHYCFKKNTGGRLKAAVLGSLVADPHRLGTPVTDLADALVTAGLLDKTEIGYALSAYTRDNLVNLDPPEVVEARREKQRIKMRNWRRNQVTNQVTNRVTNQDSDQVRDAAQTRPDQTISDQEVSSPSETMAASPPEPSQPPEKRTKKPPSSTAQRVWEIYDAAFFVDCGAHPDPQDYYFVQINRLLKRHTPEEIGQRLKNYFESPPWVCREGSRDFGRFLKFFDQLAVAAGETGSEMVDRVLVDGPKRAAMLAANGHRTMLNGGTP